MSHAERATHAETKSHCLFKICLQGLSSQFYYLTRSHGGTESCVSEGLTYRFFVAKNEVLGRLMSHAERATHAETKSHCLFKICLQGLSSQFYYLTRSHGGTESCVSEGLTYRF